MEERTVKLFLLEDDYAIVKFKADQGIPAWAVIGDDDFISITRTKDELSIVCKEAKIAADNIEHIEKPWRCLKVEGPLDFSLTGILNELTRPLAEHNISIFAISTYDTDYLLVKSQLIERTIQVLEEEGHIIESRVQICSEKGGNELNIQVSHF